MKEAIRSLLDSIYSKTPNIYTLWVVRGEDVFQVLNQDESPPFARLLNINTDKSLALLDGFDYASKVYKVSVTGTGYLGQMVEDELVLTEGIPTANDSYFLSRDGGVVLIPAKFIKREERLGVVSAIYLSTD